MPSDKRYCDDIAPNTRQLGHVPLILCSYLYYLESVNS